MKIAGVYLAAGNSSRMGTNKLALNVGTMTLGSLALETAIKSKLEKIYIITKESDNVDWLPETIKSNEKCTVVKCATAQDGQSESLRCGTMKAQADQMDAILIMLADQPFITVQMLDEMITCMKKNPYCKFVATSYEQKIMPPVLFSASMYGDLQALRGDTGARAILHGDFLHYGKLLPCTDNRLVFDVDTIGDYQSIKIMD